MSRIENDPIVQELRRQGRPVTKESWMALALPNGASAEVMEYIPEEIARLKPGEELKNQTTTTSRSSVSTPWFAKAAKADHARRKKPSSATSKER